MTDETFNSLFQGRQNKLERKINVDNDLLGKLEESGIITDLQRQQIEVTLFCKF